MSAGFYSKIDENGRGAGGLGCIAGVTTAARFRELEGGAGQTKITKAMVTVGVPLTIQRADDRKSGFRARAGRCGGLDAEGVSSTIRGLGRCY